MQKVTIHIYNTMIKFSLKHILITSKSILNFEKFLHCVFISYERYELSKSVTFE